MNQLICRTFPYRSSGLNSLSRGRKLSFTSKQINSSISSTRQLENGGTRNVYKHVTRARIEQKQLVTFTLHQSYCQVWIAIQCTVKPYHSSLV